MRLLIAQAVVNRANERLHEIHGDLARAIVHELSEAMKQ